MVRTPEALETTAEQIDRPVIGRSCARCTGGLRSCFIKDRTQPKLGRTQYDYGQESFVSGECPTYMGVKENRAWADSK